MYKVISTVDNPEYLPLLNRYKELIIGQNAHMFHGGNFKPEDHHVAFVLIDGSWIAGFSTIHTPAHWPDNVARIMTRTYVDPIYREGFCPKGGMNWRYAGDQIMKFCEERDLMPVITRPPRALNAILRFAGEGWKISDKEYMTTTNGHYQALLYKGDERRLDAIPSRLPV